MGALRTCRGRSKPDPWMAAFASAILLAACAGSVPTRTPQTGLPWASSAASPFVSPPPASAVPSTSAPPRTPAIPVPTPLHSTAPASLVTVAVASALGRDPSEGFDRSTKVPALGQFVTWRFDGGTAIAGRTLQVQSLASSFPAVWTTIGSVVAGPSGVATFQTAFDHPAFLSLRVSAPAEGDLPSVVSRGLQASWRGTGPCPVALMTPDPQLEGEELMSPDGTAYRVDRGWDAAGNWQDTLVALHAGGGPGWRYVFPACADLDAPVFDALGGAYIVDRRQSAGADAIYTFDAHGRTSAQPSQLPGECHGMAQAPDGVVYAWGEDVRRADGVWVEVRSSFLVALAASGHPAPGWPYSVAGPMSDPVFGPDGTGYLVTGYVGGQRALVAPASRRNLIVALQPDGSLLAGWPVEFPADVTPLPVGFEGEGGIPSSQPPVLGPDGTIYATAERIADATGPDLVYAFTPDGTLQHGWPYEARLSDGSLGVECTGCGIPGTLPPVPAGGGVVYVAERVGSGAAAHDEVAALGSNGRPRPGWPFSFAAGEGVSADACWHAAADVRYQACWLGFALDGTLVLHVLTRGESRQACLRPNGEIVDCRGLR